MKISNFKIEDTFSSIEVRGRHIDLHNNFKFMGLNYNVSKREISLYWHKRDAEWVKEDDPNALSLVFSSVLFFKTQERDIDAPLGEDDCLSSIGFIGNEMLDEVEGYSYTEPKENANHLNVSFMSGFAIKVSAEGVECIQS